MTGKLLWVPLISGLVLIANFVVLMKYGDTLQSTHLFIVRGTVFYPLAWLNLIFGVLLIALVVRGWVSGKQK
jgi:hypothetical protein